jgi:outer membrane protein assembly factor BamB
MFQYGLGSSPRIDSGVVIVSAEYDGPDSGIYGLDPSDGSQVWKADRLQTITFSTPISAELDGRRQLLLSGAHEIASYDPATGKRLWRVGDGTWATCGTMVWDPASGLAFASGGFPDLITLAIQTSGEHEVVWKHPIKCYEQSLLVCDGHVYAVSDRGVAYCWRAIDGEECWRERLGGKFSSSPLLVGDTIYVTSETGATFVFKASPERFEQLAENQLGDDCFPTTTPSDGRLYHRYGQGHGDQRQEFLVSIGESS